MKCKQIFSRHLFVFCLLYFSFFKVEASNWSAGLHIEILQVSNTLCGAGATNCYELKVENIPLNVIPSGTVHGYSFLWIFDDGTFEKSTIAPYQTSVKTYHEFYKGGVVRPKLQLAAHYEDDERPDKIELPDNSNGMHILLPAGGFRPIPIEDEKIKLEYSLKPRSGDTMTYVISYKNSCIQNNRLNAVFRYGNNGKAKIVGSPRFYGDEVLVSDDGNDLMFQTTIAGGINPQFNVFVDITFTGIVEHEKLNFHCGLANEGGKIDGCIESNVNVLTELTSVKSHDPNLLVSDRNKICPTPPSEMTYAIIFQNIGGGPAQEVIVKNELPDCFHYDLSKITVIKPIGLIPILDNTGESREMLWVLSENNRMLKQNYNVHQLKGTGEPNFKSGRIKEHQTVDSIIFTVKFDSSKPLTPCSAIAHSAEIYFDNNPAVTTNDFLTVVDCDSCTPCQDDGMVNWMQPLLIYEKSKMNLEWIQSHDFQKCSISPAGDITETGGGDFVLNANKSAIYTIVLTNGCKREIIKLPVTVLDSSSIVAQKYNWWSCKLTLLPLTKDNNFSSSWIFEENGILRTYHGNELSLKGLKNVTARVTTLSGQFTLSPCITCWRTWFLQKWWILLSFGLLVLLFLIIKKYRT